MRTISTNVLNALKANSMTYFYLVDFDFRPGLFPPSIFPNGNGYITSLPMDTIATPVFGTSSVTYSAEFLVGIDPPRVSSITDRNAYKIVLADPTGAVKNAFDLGITGTPVAIRVGFYLNGAPNLNPADLVLAYQGVIDSYSSSNDFEERTATIECSSPLADLDLQKQFLAGPDAIRLYNANDTSFDQILEGAGQLKYKWGKS